MSGRRQTDFEVRVLPHMGAAYSLARWLLRHPQDAEDAVQDSVLKAYRAFDQHTGPNTAAWLLAIVRNTCLTALAHRTSDGKVIVLDDLARSSDRQAVEMRPDPAPLADEAMIAQEQRRRIHAAIATLPVQFREVLILREFHDLAYRDIADIVGAPIGTIMSRLARARDQVRTALTETAKRERQGSTS